MSPAELRGIMSNVVRPARNRRGWQEGWAMRVENTIMIERPINEVFKYVSIPENDPTWVPLSLWHERKAPGPMRVGTTTEEDVAIL